MAALRITLRLAAALGLAACAGGAAGDGTLPPCTARAPAAAAVAHAPAPPPANDAAACLVSMAALRREPGAPHLLDARRGGGLRAPIAGATPVDTAAADALAVFDKAAKLLLVGAADEVRALTEVCARWRAQGHAGVRVLAGGVEALPPAAAAAAPPAPPVFVSAGMLQRQAALAPASLVFDAGTDAPLQRIGRAANVARPGEAPRHAARRIARELARSGVVAGLDPLIVVVADHRAAPAWREAWQATAYANPRFYLGSDAEFRVALARDERMATDRGKPLPGPCDR